MSQLGLLLLIMANLVVTAAFNLGHSELNPWDAQPELVISAHTHKRTQKHS
jgi:hypothetical protein